MKTKHRALLLATILSLSGLMARHSMADTLVIVVHPGNPTTEIGNSDLMRLWMGKTRQFPGGGAGNSGLADGARRRAHPVRCPRAQQDLQPGAGLLGTADFHRAGHSAEGIQFGQRRAPMGVRHARGHRLPA